MICSRCGEEIDLEGKTLEEKLRLVVAGVNRVHWTEIREVLNIDVLENWQIEKIIPIMTYLGFERSVNPFRVNGKLGRGFIQKSWKDKIVKFLNSEIIEIPEVLKFLKF